MLTLDTYGSRPEGETDLRLQTPESSPSVQPAEPPYPRELVVDATCVDMLRPLFESKGIRLVSIDVAAVLSSGTTGSLIDATAIVIGPQVRMGLNAIVAVEQLRAALPHVGLYVVGQSTGDIARTLPRLAVSGVDEVFALDVAADVEAMVKTLDQRLAAPLPVTEIKLLWKWFRESPERSLVMHCVRNGFRLDVWEIRSRIFMQSRKNLHNRMIMAGLPSPGILSRCGRVLHAQELERRGGVLPTRIASILGFRTPGGLLRCRRRLRNALLTRGRNSVVFLSLLK